MNLGILGCSKIAYTAIVFPIARLKHLKLYGIASRDSDKAEHFAKRCKIPRAFKSYDALLENQEIDCVYIALPNHLHKDMILRAIAQKKHILVEKPICLNAMEIDEIIAASQRNNVYVLEAVMIQHHPWQGAVLQYIESGVLGRVLAIHLQVGFVQMPDFEQNYRSFPECGGGCFYDLAPYWLQIVQALFGLQTYTFQGQSDFDGPHGCDMNFTASMQFGNSRHSTFSASFVNPFTAALQIVFERSTITIPNIFASNLGNHQIEMFIGSDPVLFPKQNYYLNQLDYFSTHCHDGSANSDLLLSKIRISLLEKIYNDALRKKLANREQIE